MNANERAEKKIHVVAIGGGTGTSQLIAGLKKYPVKISAVISTADDGSSSGKLREEFGMVPPGDMRQCLVALADNEKLAKYFHTRFAKGNFHGHALGNLLLALLYQEHHNIQKAVDEACILLGIDGHEVLPTTLLPTTLVASLDDGTTITGEANITLIRELQKKNARLSLSPEKHRVNPRACEALKCADAIVVGPGNLFTSILPSLMPKEIKDAFLASRAKKILIANLMTQRGHTENFTPYDFARAVEMYMGAPCFDLILYNTKAIPQKLWNKNIGFKPVVEGFQEKKDVRFVAGKFFKSTKKRRHEPADPLVSMRSLALHDEDALAEKIFSYLNGNNTARRKK